jgi:hypothetical protein
VYEITVRCNGYPGAVKLTTSDCNTFCFTLSREGRKLCRAAADGLITLSILAAERRADTGGNGMELANPPHIINMPFVSKGVIQGCFYRRCFSRVSHPFARIAPYRGHHGIRVFHSSAQRKSENCGVRNNHPERSDETQQCDAQWIGAIPVLTNSCVSSEKGKEIHDDKD